MQRTLIRLFRVLPLGVLYGCMALVIPFYMLFAKGFRASYSFFRKRLKYNSLKSFFHVYLNEYAFGQAKAFLFFIILACVSLVQVRISNKKEVEL